MPHTSVRQFKLQIVKSNFLHAMKSMSLIFTVFVVFIMSLITQFLLNISHHDIASINIALLGERTLFAAKSGVVWGLTNAIINKACPSPTTTTINLSQYGTMDFKVKVNCEFVSSNNSNLIKVTATANYKNIEDHDYATRTAVGKYQLSKD